MACAVCQHCQLQLFKDDKISMREGYSYHKKCHKCYVCSETDLHNAEVFKGVIFCSSCSQRIFQGCFTARKCKNGSMNKSARAKSRGRRKEKSKVPERYTQSARTPHTNGVLELARLAASSESESSNYKVKSHDRISSTTPFSTGTALQIGKDVFDDQSFHLKKNSIEMGMITEVTQELLWQMNCPVVTERKKGQKPTSLRIPKEKGDSRYNKTIICSDLRIAELGASTEIAHMALRKPSEIPVIIKSESGRKSLSYSLSESNVESDVSANENDEWLETSYSSKLAYRHHWLDRRIGSILKMPYKFFKKNILDRSSLITMVINDENKSNYIMKRLKLLFREDIVEHQHRGIKRLFSTINRRKAPYKLGWLNQMTKVSAVKRCKHYNRSHSYRCMRAQVMKLAGPTKSELTSMRCKIKKCLVPGYLRRFFGLNKCPAIMTSQACGSDLRSLRNARSN